MIDDRTQIKNYQKKAIASAVLAVVVAVGLGAAHFLYFGPQTDVEENLVVIPGLKIDVEKNREQFQQIKNELIQGERFQALEKYSEWPLVNVGVEDSKSVPFILPVVEEPEEVEGEEDEVEIEEEEVEVAEVVVDTPTSEDDSPPPAPTN